jgi:hypothetical protein
MLWEAIRVDCFGILELPPKTFGGNSSVTVICATTENEME